MRRNAFFDLDPIRPRQRSAVALEGRVRATLGQWALILAAGAWLAAPGAARADDEAAATNPVADAPLAARAPPAGTAAAEDPLPDKPYGRPQAVRRRGQSLDYRMKLLTAELNLDASQQVEVRRALEDQRAQIQALWASAAIPAGQRVNATKVISDKTAARIRGLLNEEQRKRYSIERKPPAPGDTAGKPDVEHWMEATRPK